MCECICGRYFYVVIIVHDYEQDKTYIYIYMVVVVVVVVVVVNLFFKNDSSTPEKSIFGCPFVGI